MTSGGVYEFVNGDGVIFIVCWVVVFALLDLRIAVAGSPQRRPRMAPPTTVGAHDYPAPDPG
jgi:hypothetical protein